VPSYAWKGRNRAGSVQEGALVADSKELALAQLRRQNIVVTGIRERGKEISLSKVGRKVPPSAAPPCVRLTLLDTSDGPRYPKGTGAVSRRRLEPRSKGMRIFLPSRQ